MTKGVRSTYDFCWINLMSPNGPRARDFFAKLLGWTYADMPGVPGGHIIQVGGLGAGAFMDLDIVKMPDECPPCIGVMVKVEDADVAAAKVRALGGQAEPPFEVMQNGRMVSCIDPNGAMFALWQPLSKQGFEMDSQAHGAASWFETISRDVSKAVGFYEGLFGWTHEVVSPVPQMNYTMFLLNRRPIAGAFNVAEHTGGNTKDVPSHWATTFTVKGVDEVARRAKELGGQLCIGPDDVPGVGRFAQLLSPERVSFAVIEYRDQRWTQ